MLGRFIHQTNERRLDPAYTGRILLWDIDKTYLDTRFSSWRGLLAIPFEVAIDKQSVPGAVPLLRALRRGPEAQPSLTPLYFVSGSPPQLRRIVEKKMTLDGVQYDGITFKDQLGLVLARRPKDVKRQIGYKLAALLGYRTQLPDGARWLMFGDDVESDAEVFGLFGEVCAGLRGPALQARLNNAAVHAEDAAIIMDLVHEMPVTADPVERIYIHLTAGRDPESFSDPRVVPCRSYIQTVLALARDEVVAPTAIGAVAKALRRRQIPETTIAVHLQDARRRLGVPHALTEQARA